MSNKSRVNLAWLQVYVTLRLWLCMYGAAFPVRGMGSWPGTAKRKVNCMKLRLQQLLDLLEHTTLPDRLSL